MSVPAGYKPSPLSFGSPRSSPFRRPESPASPVTIRATTPSSSPTKLHTPRQSPTKADPFYDGSDLRTARGLSLFSHAEATPSPPRMGPITPIAPATIAENPKRSSTDMHGKLNAGQARELREAFQLLDRDGDGLVGREDVVEMLNSLGQDSQAALSAFFPPGQPQRLTLAQFLTQLSALLSSMSRPDELDSAFAAFDDDDNGQIDVNDLQDALLHTPPEQDSQRRLSKADIEKVIDGFTSRKTVGKRLGRGDVFRYQEFLAAVTGFGDKPAHEQELRE